LDAVKSHFYRIETQTDRSCTILSNAVQTSTKLKGKLVDIDGNIYPTVKIGEQIWMAENLAVTKFNDGTPLKFIECDMSGEYPWTLEKEPAYTCRPFTEEQGFGSKPFILYNGYSIKNNICPKGWKVPTENDWNQLIEFVRMNGYDTNPAFALKSVEHWRLNDDEFGGGDDYFGFNGLPIGQRDADGVFNSNGLRTSFWADKLAYDLWYNREDNVGEAILM